MVQVWGFTVLVSYSFADASSDAGWPRANRLQCCKG